MEYSPQINSYRLVSALFLRSLALIYLVAFVSIGIQVVGLVGSEGILPVTEALQGIEERLGPERYWLYPSLFWINAGDTMLRVVPIVGCIFSILLFFNVQSRVSLILLFVLYLSLFHAGQIFMNFQWDYLLLESGFLAIFLPSGSRQVIWLYRWLLFRFRFLSGAAKLISQDPSWASLTALNFYFETQPLPHWGGWYAHQLPEWLLQFGTGSALFIELVIPFMMFLPRRPRFFAAWTTIMMQVFILLTSNHNFANLLTIALCLFLFDDRALSRIMSRSVANWLLRGPATAPAARPLRTMMLSVLTGLIVFISLLQIGEMLSGHRSPAPFAAITDLVRPFRIVNKYHVFPTMKTERIEIIVEGSTDGHNWQTYEFQYKPGNLHRRPEFIVPHQPRLDWLMWFVPVDPIFLTWFESFLYRLLQNSPVVVDLLKANPFSEQPPKYLRISVYRYHFTEPEVREANSQWWTREYLGPFFPLPWLEEQTPEY